MSNTTDDLIRLSFFTDMARAIASATSLEETLQQIMHQVGSIFAPRNWSLMLRDAETGELEFTLVTGGAEVSTLQGRRLPPGTGIAGWIAEHREALIIPDVSADPRFDPSMDELSNFTTQSIVGVPLVSRGEVFGVIELINKLNGEPFTALDLKVLSTIGDFAAIAVEKAYYLAAMQSMALEDELTGLGNRRTLTRTLEHEARRAKRTATPVAMMVIDVDEFKRINDSQGHPAGDRILQHLAQLVESNVRDVDTVCRYGGDEFVVVMPDTNATQAEDTRRRLAAAIQAEAEAQSARVPVPYTVSIGVHAAGPDEVDSLFEQSDLHLYREKRRKQNRDIQQMSRHLTEFLDDDGSTDPA